MDRCDLSAGEPPCRPNLMREVGQVDLFGEFGDLALAEERLGAMGAVEMTTAGPSKLRDLVGAPKNPTASRFNFSQASQEILNNATWAPIAHPPGVDQNRGVVKFQLFVQSGE